VTLTPRHARSVSQPAGSGSPAVSIVIPCFNEADHIEECLRSILEQDPIDGGFEIIVADGMSTDGTRQILATLKSQMPLRIVDNPARIQAAGLNAAIAEAKGSIIIRMDAHTTYAQDYVRECVAVLVGSGADNVGGPAFTQSASYMQRAISAAYHSPFAVGGARFHDRTYEGYVDTVPYGCWRREIFERIGPFDEHLCRNEDDEFNLRLTRSGGKIWQSVRIKSWYSPRSSLIALFRQYLQYGYWKVGVIRKHRVPASWRHLVPGLFVLSLFLTPMILVWPSLWMLWGAIIGAYLTCTLLASILVAGKEDWALLPVLPAVFACYHVAYGSGFLHGVCDFVLLHRGPSTIYTQATRTTINNRQESSDHQTRETI
jgi:succinoglycan biosynthesis protein ExoA